MKQTWAEVAAAVCHRERDYFIEAVREWARTREKTVTHAEALIQEIIEDIRDMENENVLIAKMRILASLRREEYRPEFVKEILDADAAPPEGTISDISELISPRAGKIMTMDELERLIYEEVKADIETVADADGPFQEGYAVGFNDCRYRVLRRLCERLGLNGGHDDSQRIRARLRAVWGP